MKNFTFLFIFFLIISCNYSKKLAYWCGDHPCVSVNEKENYFKENMIVEVKEIKRTSKDNSKINEIIEQAKLKEKKRKDEKKDLVKQAKFEEKERTKKKKALAKQEKLEEKERIKKKKTIAKQNKLNELKRIKEEKDLVKQIEIEETENYKIKNEPKDSLEVKIDQIETNKFNELVEKINNKNLFRPYPDINDIPN